MSERVQVHTKHSVKNIFMDPREDVLHNDGIGSGCSTGYLPDGIHADNAERASDYRNERERERESHTGGKTSIRTKTNLKGIEAHLLHFLAALSLKVAQDH
jgi:hypothetical protein